MYFFFRYYPPMVGELTAFLHAEEVDPTLALKKQQHEWRHLLRTAVSAVDDGSDDRPRVGSGAGGGGAGGGADEGRLLGRTADVVRQVARAEVASMEDRNTLLSYVMHGRHTLTYRL
jgi:hypothetical protein